MAFGACECFGSGAVTQLVMFDDEDGEAFVDGPDVMPDILPEVTRGYEPQRYIEDFW